MSGIVGILNLDGAPVDRLLLTRMTRALAFRGPDSQDVWAEGPVGFGHTKLLTGPQPAEGTRTFSLDGRICITADARIDDRETLLSKLRTAGCECSLLSTDAQLILHAYAAWGDRCTENLLGDFSFAIWDGLARKLFCACDHFGVKPFFYAQVGRRLLFSNTLDCLRLHPDVSNALNDLAVADFLLFEIIQEPDATTFRDIQRLPAAHTLTWSDGALKVKRYWELPVEAPLVYRRGSEYFEQFWTLLCAAVKDRLPAEGAAVLMSGGLDSTTVAAAAKELLAEKTAGVEVRAYTQVFDRVVSHPERRYATLAAQGLGIPIEFHSRDDYRLGQGLEQPACRQPEPSAHPFVAADRDLQRQIAVRHRVLLTGLGADPGFSTCLSEYGRLLIRERKFGRLLRDFAGHLFTEGRLRRLYLRTRLRNVFVRDYGPDLFPPWLNPEVSARLDLPARWHERNHPQTVNYGVRPSAYESLASPVWPAIFKDCDPGTIQVALEWRHPFFDLRLLCFLLRIPPLPWASDKQLLRETVRGRLPEPVRLRRKTPLESDPTAAAVRRGDARYFQELGTSPELEHFVLWDHVPRLTGREDPNELRLHLRPAILNVWLQTGYHTPDLAQ